MSRIEDTRANQMMESTLVARHEPHLVSLSTYEPKQNNIRDQVENIALKSYLVKHLL